MEQKKKERKMIWKGKNLKTLGDVEDAFFDILKRNNKADAATFKKMYSNALANLEREKSNFTFLLGELYYEEQQQAIKLFAL